MIAGGGASFAADHTAEHGADLVAVDRMTGGTLAEAKALDLVEIDAARLRRDVERRVPDHGLITGILGSVLGRLEVEGIGPALRCDSRTVRATHGIRPPRCLERELPSRILILQFAPAQ